uniref:RNA-directed RNA polymerase L n=1 Tax=Volzhskoe tick virus TaxID=2789421 RepID=A0A7S8F9F3_9VIRU|nr:RNA-dependent RNA-polymerase [Volzhskoe tick virus]
MGEPDWEVTLEPEDYGEDESLGQTSLGTLLIFEGSLGRINALCNDARGSKRPDFEACRAAFDEMRVNRHEHFSNLFRSANHIDLDTTDVDHSQYILKKLQEGEASEGLCLTLEARLKEPQFRNLIRKTPDSVRVTSDEKGAYKVDFLEFGVNLGGEASAREKLEKYKGLLDIYSALDPNLTIVTLNPSTMKAIEMQAGREVQWEHPQYTDETKDLMKRSTVMAQKLMEVIKPSEKEVFRNYINSSVSYSRREEPDKQLPFSLKVQEFMKGHETLDTSSVIFKSLNQEHKALLIEGLLYTSLTEEGKSELLEESKKVLGDQPLRTRNEWELFFEEKSREYQARARDHTCRDTPSRPTEDDIWEAVHEAHKAAEAHFEAMEHPKLSTHIPFAFKIEGCGTVDQTPKSKFDKIHKRTADFYTQLNRVSEPDYVIEVLRDIFMAGALDSEGYKLLCEGKVAMARDQRTDEPMLTKRDAKPRPTKILGIAKETEEPINLSKDLEDVMHDSSYFEENKSSHTIAMKKGRVLVVRPSSSKKKKDFELLAGVGKKKTMLGAEPKLGRKVKSLAYFNKQVLDEHSSEHEVHMQEMITICETAGRLIPESEVDTSVREEESLKVKVRQMINEIQSKVSTPSGSTDESQSSEQDESKGRPTYVGKSDTTFFERGLHHFGRTHQVFYENISFISQMASSGFRVVFSNNECQAVITMPSESIMKGDTAVPFIVVTILGPNDLYCSMGDHNEMIYHTQEGNRIIVTKGRRVNRAQMMGHMDSFPRFQLAKSIMSHFKSQSGNGDLTAQDMMRMFTFINRISISSSSLLDNARYMVELCMADYSNVRRYIEDNFMVPIKTRVHAYMYQRLLRMLTKVNQSMETIKMRKPQVTEDGEVDISSMRIVDGEFPSYLFDHTYRKPDQLLQEVITLFFCTPKALHGKFHNAVNIHKTPLEIQEPLNNIDLKSTCTESVSERCHYNPVMVALATMAAEGSCGASPEQVRSNFRRIEKPECSPLSVSTLTSTRSTLIERPFKKTEEWDIDDLSEVDRGALTAGAHPKTVESVRHAIAINAERIADPRMPPHARQKIWRRLKKKVLEELGEKSQLFRLMTHSISLNAETGQLYLKPKMMKDKAREQLVSIIDQQCKAEKGEVNSELSNLPVFACEAAENYRFYDSGVVLTETLNKVLSDREAGKETTITSMAVDAMEDGSNAVFAVRPKGQRTQKDREIFVLDLGTKACLYLLEHFYKQMCVKIPAEKISLPGDLKVIDMYNQAKTEITWCRQALEIVAAREEHEDEENVMCIHFDIDMTKWAPKDNLLKYYWVVAYCQYLRLGEKLFYFRVLDRMWRKLMYLDDTLLLQSMKNIGQGDAEGEECIFYRSTDGYKRNLIPIQMTWLQGQLNYMSSFLHAGVMKVFEDSVEGLVGRENCLVHANVHSDDNETTVCCKTKEDFSSVALELWKYLDFFTRQVCIEISIKKSYISRTAKSFISIYNIGGEQIHPWVKPLMTTVSGLPYLTIADDISSALSKVAEAGSKGAPKTTLQVAINIARRHILDSHGILDKKENTNKFSKLLGVPEELLPTTLGGMHVRDMTSLIIGGPKVVDKMNLMVILRQLTGAQSDKPPSKEVNYKNPGLAAKPPLQKHKKEEVIKALKLIVLSDLLCYETIDDEECNTQCKGLNFLRPAKFLMRRSGDNNPFKPLTMEELRTEAEKIKSETPQIMVQKPTCIKDLLNYYKCQYADTKFQDSLAGQSPAMLKLSMIQQRHKPRYRLLHTGKIGEGEVAGPDPEEVVEGDKEFEEVESKVVKGIPITLQELGLYLNKRMERLRPHIGDCQMLWARYCSCDPEFKCLQFVCENSVTGSTFRRQNTIPIKKPDFQKYSNMMNTVASIISVAAGDTYAQRNGFTLRYPQMAGKDWIVLENMFPRECMILKYLAMRNPGDHKALMDMLAAKEELVEVPKQLLKYRSEELRAMGNPDETDFAIADKLRKKVNKEKNRLMHWVNLEYKDVYESADEFRTAIMESGSGLPSWTELSKAQEGSCSTLSRNLCKDLVRMTRTFKMETGKVLFCPPTASADLLSVTLQLRSITESLPSRQFTMHLSRQLSAKRSQALLEEEAGSVKWCEFAVRAISLLFEVMRNLGLSKSQITMALKSTFYAGKPAIDITRQIIKLSKGDLQKALTPMCLIAPEYSTVLLQQACPHTKVWPIPQHVHGTGPFSCKVIGNGFRFIAIGHNRVITELRIESNKQRIPLEEINAAVQDIAKDVYYGGRRAFHGEVHLNKVFVISPPPDDLPEGKIVLGHGNKLITSGRRRAVGIIGAIKFSDCGDKWRHREISYIDTLDNLYGIKVKEDGNITEVQHRFDPEAEMNPIQVDPVSDVPVDLNKVISKVNYRAIINRRWNQVSLDSLISCMREPGVYTGLVGSVHARFFMKLIFTELKDGWLDSDTDGKSTFQRVRGHLEDLMVYHQRDADQDREVDITKELNEISSLEHALAMMSSVPGFSWSSASGLVKMLEEKKQKVHEMTMKKDRPIKPYNIPEDIAKDTLLMLSKLERWPEVEKHNEKEREYLLDMLIGNYPSREIDFVVQSSSVASVMKEAVGSFPKRHKRVPRRKRAQNTLAEVLRQADVPSLSEEEAAVMARGIGLMLSLTRDQPSIAYEAVIETMDGLSGDKKSVMLLVETAAARLDSHVFYSIPCVQYRRGAFPEGVRVETEKECGAMMRSRICESGKISSPVKLSAMVILGASECLSRWSTGGNGQDYVMSMLSRSRGHPKKLPPQEKREPAGKSIRMVRRTRTAVEKAYRLGLTGTDAITTGLSDARMDDLTTMTDTTDGETPTVLTTLQSGAGFPKLVEDEQTSTMPVGPSSSKFQEFRFRKVTKASLLEMSDSDESD